MFKTETIYIKILIFLLIIFSNDFIYGQAASQGKNDPGYRPLFHFTPKKNWINDPNGLVFYKNNYHLFFQYNPFGDKWGHMSWGHATSKDLIKWKEMQVAIPEYKNSDNTTTMIFSGNAVVDSFNTTGFGTKRQPSPLVAIYTANITKHDTGIVQYQNLAYSLDGIKFIQYSKNPVLDVKAKDFRDPKIFWYAPEKKWVMIVSMPTEHKVQFYSSGDLKSWTFMSDFGNTGNVDRVWECPDIFELPVINSKEKKWVITVSAGHPQEGFLAMQYFVGNFNGSLFKLDKMQYPLYVDYGKDFYAGITYNNIPGMHKRRIMIGWANDWEYANDIPTKGFRGMMAIPRTLSLKKSADGQYLLLQMPVVELEKYRSKILFDKKSAFDLKEFNDLNLTGDALDIEFEIPKKTIGKTGIKVFKHGNEETFIYFDAVDNMLKIDRTHSGNVSFNGKFPGIDSVLIPQSVDDLKFRVLIDNSIVEVFINDGEYVLTDLVFPQKRNGLVQFFATNPEGMQFRKVKVWQMNALIK